MKEFTLNANSWHFRLANYGRQRIDSYDIKHGTDFCSYLRCVMKGAFSMSTVILLVGLAVSWTGFSVYDVVQFFIQPEHEIHGPTIGFLVSLTVLSVSALAGLAGAASVEFIQHRLQNSNKSREPGFFTLTYRKFKEKTCFKINFEDRL